MKRSGKNFALALLLLFACLLAAPPEAAAQRIAVFPFDIHSERDATLLRNAIYNSMTLELGKVRTIQIVPREQFAPLVSGKTADEALALSVGKQIRADYVIVGSLTQFGNRVSLDAKAVTVETGAVITGLFAQGAGIENTGAFAAQLARDILARVSGTQVIARIDLTGNRRIESTVIYNVLKGAKGKLYSEEDLSSDIRAIYRTGYFTDVKADVTDSADGKVITFLLEERPFVNEIRIKGNDAVKADDIRGVLSFKVKQVYNPDRIKADADKIKALYDDKGYYNAEISFATEKVKERDVNVIIDIKENDLLYVKTIEFTGNQAFTNKELKGLLETSEWNMLLLPHGLGCPQEGKAPGEPQPGEGLLHEQRLHPGPGGRAGDHTRQEVDLYPDPRLRGQAVQGRQGGDHGRHPLGPQGGTPRQAQHQEEGLLRPGGHFERPRVPDADDPQRRLCLRRDQPQEPDDRGGAEGRHHLRHQERKPRLLQPDQHHRQHEDPRQGHPAAADVHGRGSLQQRQAEEQLRPAQPAPLLRGGEFSDRQRARGEPDGHQHRRQGAPHGDVLDRRRLQRPGRRHAHGPDLPAEPLRPGTEPEPPGGHRNDKQHHQPVFHGTVPFRPAPLDEDRHLVAHTLIRHVQSRLAGGGHHLRLPHLGEDHRAISGTGIR